MHLLNKNPSPQNRGDKGVLAILLPNQTKSDFSPEQPYKFPNLVSYALVILFLTGVFFAFQSFSAWVSQHQLWRTANLVKQGKEVVGENLMAGSQVLAKQLIFSSDSSLRVVKSRWAKFLSQQIAFVNRQELIFENGFHSLRSSLDSSVQKFLVVEERLATWMNEPREIIVPKINKLILVAKTEAISREIVGGIQTVKDTVEEISKTKDEFFGGVGQGIKLFSDNVIFSGELAKNMVWHGYYTASQSIYDTLSLANEKLVQTEEKMARQINVWPEKNIQDSLLAQKIRQISSVTITHQEPELTATTSSATSTEQEFSASWSAWSDWIAKPGFIPVIFTTYEKKISPLRDKLNVGILAITDTNNSMVDNISISWNNFFKQFSGGNPTDNLSDASLREQLKQEILQELQNGNTATISNGTVNSMYTGTGIFLMKQTGSSTIDLNNVKKLQDSFSDRVLVNFNQAGDTGVIQPIFRDRLGEKYIFVITPIKK